jgi:hypothetical protein
MYPLYVRVWCEGTPIDRARFEQRLRPSSVSVGDGRTTVHVACGNLFTDHVIELRLGPRGGVREVCLAG